LRFYKGWNIIKIKYKNKKIQKQCTDYCLAKKDFGVQVAEKLFSLIEFINNACNLNDVAVIPTHHLHPLHGARNGEFSLDLGRRLGWRLIVIPLNDEGNKWDTNDISIIYKSTSVILVLEVSNHYE